MRTVPASPNGPGAERGHADALMHTSALLNLQTMPSSRLRSTVPWEAWFHPKCHEQAGRWGDPRAPPTLPQPPRTKQLILGSFQRRSAAVNITLAAVGRGSGPSSSLAAPLGWPAEEARIYASWVQSSKGQKAAPGGARNAGVWQLPGQRWLISILLSKLRRLTKPLCNTPLQQS